MSLFFSLEVRLSNLPKDNDDGLAPLNESLENDSSEGCTVAFADSCRIIQPLNEKPQQGSPRFALVFVPATIVDSSLEQHSIDVNKNAPGYVCLDAPEAEQLSKRLLAMVHPFLAQNFPIKAVIPIRNEKSAAADLVLLDLLHTPEAAIADLLDQTSCQTLHCTEDAILKILLVSKVQFQASSSSIPAGEEEKQRYPGEDPELDGYDVPTCPVCLHRVAPWRLGIDTPLRTGQICSKFCPPPNLLPSSGLTGGEISCPRQRLLNPWPLPAHCAACAVIDRYWSHQDGAAAAAAADERTHRSSSTKDLFCYTCAMQETLWVCLTCAFVGCGRYSNKHAEEHNRESGHPYCLELSTLRIWGYACGDFVHRADMLECPSSPPLMHPWIPTASFASRGYSYAASSSGYSQDPLDVQQRATLGRRDPHLGSSLHAQHPDQYYGDGPSLLHQDEKQPKKATMIGEEYEALLQSALEEQAQHYEGEITRLRAALTAEQIDQESMTEQEHAQIEHQKMLIDGLRADIENVGRELLELQSQEAGHRAASQRLLREQQVAQDLLKKIREESSREQNEGRRQVDELEQQIEDLTANQRMRDQFSQDQELANAQIFGTVGTEKPKSAKKGKKSRRFFRK